MSLDDKSIELLFNTQIAQLVEFITKKTGTCAILVGPPGTGKTITLNYVARRLGYRVWTVDPVIDQDIDKVLGAIRFKPLTPTILHVLVDGLTKSEIEKVVKASRDTSYVVVLEATTNVETTCIEVRFYKPRARDVVKVMESMGIRPDQVKMFSDLRQLVLAKYGTLGYDTEKSLTKTLEESLKTGTYSETSDSALLLLLDSAHLNFYGKDLYFFVKALQITNKCKKPHPLNGFRSVKPVIISYFLEKLKMTREY